MQQAGVLREHTDLEVGDYCGEMRVDNWKIPKWQGIFHEMDVIVCTPAILLRYIP